MRRFVAVLAIALVVFAPLRVQAASHECPAFLRVLLWNLDEGALSSRWQMDRARTARGTSQDFKGLAAFRRYVGQHAARCDLDRNLYGLLRDPKHNLAVAVKFRSDRSDAFETMTVIRTDAKDFPDWIPDGNLVVWEYPRGVYPGEAESELRRQWRGIEQTDSGHNWTSYTVSDNRLIFIEYMTSRDIVRNVFFVFATVKQLIL